MSSSASPFSQHPPPSVPEFKTWLDNRGAVRHEGIDLKYDESGSGWGVRATQDLERGTILCGIPRDSILSARTSSLQPSRQPEYFAGCAAFVLQLTACLLHELRLARASEWYGWLQAVPREAIEIPTFWADPDLGGKDGQRGLAWLAGTEAETELRRKHDDGLSPADLKEYHASLDLPPTDQHPDPPSLASFLYAYSLVSSRGFVIDAYHSIGLIPFCDMFNHSSSSPHTSLSNDADVCETCGSLTRCQHDEEDCERLQHLSSAYLDQLEKEGMADKVDMRVQRPIKRSEEVMSCYDEDKCNAALLVEYGFIDDERNTIMTWSYRDILTRETLPIFVDVLQRLGPPPDENNQIANGLIGKFSENQPEPLQIRSSGQISPTLFLALYLGRMSSTDPGDLVPEIVEAISQIGNLQSGDEKDFDLKPDIRSTIQSVVELVSGRLLSLPRNDSTYTELMAELESLPANSKLERLGLRAMLQERKLLETCLHRWQALVGP